MARRGEEEEPKKATTKDEGLKLLKIVRRVALPCALYCGTWLSVAEAAAFVVVFSCLTASCAAGELRVAANELPLLPLYLSSLACAKDASPFPLPVRKTTPLLVNNAAHKHLARHSGPTLPLYPRLTNVTYNGLTWAY